MSRDDMLALQPGDLIRHKHAADALVVMANYGDHLIAARVTHVSNPGEWDVIERGERKS